MNPERLSARWSGRRHIKGLVNEPYQPEWGESIAEKARRAAEDNM